MRVGQLPIDQQVRHFRAGLRRNRTLTEVLARAAVMNLPDWYLVAGCLYQTVWNVVTGQAPEAGILDYDLAYFDSSDLSWEAENVVIQAGQQIFAGLPAPVQIRNQARVHLWYGQKFGAPCSPYESTEAAIDTYEATTACLGVRLQAEGRWRIYAPHGLADVFNLVVRPNPVLAPRHVYETKTARWSQQWPSLTILPWPEHPVLFLSPVAATSDVTAPCPAFVERLRHRTIRHVALGDGRVAQLRPVRRCVQPAAGARPVLLGCLPDQLESPAHQGTAHRRYRAQLVGRRHE